MVVNTHQSDERGNVFRTVCKNKIVFEERTFVIPAGFESDGASVPRFFWRIIFPPLDHRAIRAGVAHDWIYRNQPPGWTRKDADRMFRQFLIEDGLPKFRARLAYWGVRLGGWRAWNENAAVKKTAQAVAELKEEAKQK